MRMRHTIYIALGANLGDRRANIRGAVKALAPRVRVLAESRTFETKAWGVEEQPDFLNMAVKAETQLSPQALLTHLKKLENKLGREPTFRWGPRLIDMDILFYDDLVLDLPGLAIPHPGLPERAFVLAPLADIAPEFVHPVLGRTVRELLGAVDRSGVVPA
jgi:2-amino-4-hydroxy-6-hydroxymethyldihydropteridine diphosphokinase